jgi:Rad3-related DNA helicase
VSHPTLRYVLLQPAAHFDQILQEAHSVALVGTLRPFAHMAAELLSSDKDEQLLKEAKDADERLQNSSDQICSHQQPTRHVRPPW